MAERKKYPVYIASFSPQASLYFVLFLLSLCTPSSGQQSKQDSSH
jgi:hypothetical protein